MKVVVRSVFDAPPESVWDRVQTSALLLAVIRPLLRVRPVDGPFPERWQEGGAARWRMYLFGVLPLGEHTIRLEQVDPVGRQIQSQESGSLVRSWRHLITVCPSEDGRTLYSDKVEIDGGWLTPVVWAFAAVFYRHRHRRWKALLRKEGQVVAA